MNLRTPGVFCFLDGLSGDQAGQFARHVEQLGYSALWFAEAPGGRESFFVCLVPARPDRASGRGHRHCRDLRL